MIPDVFGSVALSSSMQASAGGISMQRKLAFMAGLGQDLAQPSEGL